MGASSVTLTVTGTGFDAGTSLQIAATPVATTVVSSTELTATVPTNLLVNGSLLALVVTNNTGSSSAQPNQVSLEVDNPAPTLASANPSTLPLGAGAQILTFTGTGFVSGTAIQINGTGRPTTFVSATSATATLNPADTAAGTPLSITAANPAPGGGTSSALSIPVLNPIPGAITITPATVPAGAAPGVITVSGTQFLAGTTARVNGSVRPSLVQSPTSLSFQLTAADQATAGTLSVDVLNPAPGGGASPTVSLVIANPVPAITAVDPTSITAGASTPATVSVTGSNFVSASVAQVNGSNRPTTVEGPTQLKVQLSAADQANASTLALTITNPSPGGGASVPANFTVNNPAPESLTLTPLTVSVGGSLGIPVTVTGANFVSTSTVQINGVARATTFASASQLTFQLTPADQATAGTLAVTVANPAPGGGISKPANLVLSNPAPGSFTLTPNTLPTGGTAPATVTVNGSSFVSTSTVQVNGAPRATTFANAGQLTFQLTAADQATSGTLSIIVTTPAPGGGASPAASFTIVQPQPLLTSLTPASANLDSASLNVTLAGTNFTSTCVALLNGQPLTTTVANKQSLQFTVPASAFTSVGALAVSVRDTASKIASSNTLPLAVVNPVPAVTQYTPYSIQINATDTTISFTGSNFDHATVVLLGTTPIATTLLSTTQISAVIPAANLTEPGPLSLTVSNPAPQGGSVSVTVTVLPPVPVLSALSPANILVGSGATLVTVTGQNFTPTSTVYLPGFYTTTTYISPTSLQFTLPSYVTASTNSYPISVRDPAAQGQLSNTLTLQIVNPLPTLTAISPKVVTAGAPDFVLTLTGTGLLSSSQISLNGVAHAVSTFSGTVANFTVSAAEVANLADLVLTVTNPGPGGGTSNPETLQVITASNRLRTMGVAATALGWDAAHNLLLATTSSASTVNSNSLVAINPLQGTILKAQSLPAQADSLSVTDDDSYVYVSLPIPGEVQRLSLPSLQPDILFSLGTQSPGYPWRAEQLLPAPGHPHTVAVNRRDQGTVLGAHGGIVIYDDGVPRPNIGDSSDYYGNHDALVWGADNTTLYATNDYVSTGEEDVYAVDAHGVMLSSSQPGVLSTFVQHMAFDPTTGRLFDDVGGVVNAATEASTGTLPAVGRLPFVQNASFVLDTAQRKAFYVLNQTFNTYGSGYMIQAFDMDQYKPLNEIIVPLSGFTGLTRWGASGLAVADGTQIFLVDGSFVSPTGPSSALGTYVAPSPTILSVSPAAVPAGSPDVQLTLTGKDLSLATTVSWNNQSLPLDAVSDTQLTVTVPATMLTTPAAGPLTVTNGPGTLAARSVGFSVLPDLGSTAQLSVLNLSGKDAAWDSVRNKLYISVPYTDSAYANSIAVVDPSTPAITQVVPVLNEPGPLSLTSDAAFLYTGSFANPVVERLALPDFSLDLSIPLGSPVIPDGTPAGGRESCTFAIDIEAAPGAPHTVAIDQGNNGVEPRGCGALTVYDDAVQRPNALPWTNGGDQTSVAWGLDPTTLFGQSDPELQPQALSEFSVASSGNSLQKSLGAGGLGFRVHFDPGTGYVFSDSGIVTDPATGAKVGNLAVGLTSGSPQLALPDSANKHAYLLVQVNGPASTGTTNYALEIFNLPSLTLSTTLSLPNILGQPTQMIRWGANGLAITTSSGTGAGAVYLLQGTAFNAQ